jgi:hypothetical protein
LSKNDDPVPIARFTTLVEGVAGLTNEDIQLWAVTFDRGLPINRQSATETDHEQGVANSCFACVFIWSYLIC